MRLENLQVILASILLNRAKLQKAVAITRNHLGSIVVKLAIVYIVLVLRLKCDGRIARFIIHFDF